MFVLQTVIHFLEVGAGGRFFSYGFRVLLAALGLVVLALAYNLCAYKNFYTQEAMDSAQLARNIAEGRGYSTFFIRPLSLYLTKARNEEKLGPASRAPMADVTQVRTAHPDLANPPVYPVVLAGLMKLLHFHYAVDTSHMFWSRMKVPPHREFWRYQPDFIIAVFNQVLFIGVVALAFVLARRLFDREVAWLSAILLIGGEIFWRFSVSGLSTILLLLIFTALALCLTQVEQEARDPKGGRALVFVWACASGLLVGVGALTRYSFGWLIIPVLLFLIWSTGRQKIALALASLVSFALVLGPWVARNYNLSGMPFGTATYALVETTPLFPEHRLQRSLEPDFIRLNWAGTIRRKLVANTRQIIQNDVPKLGGTWVTAFFLAGLLVGFKNPGVRRMRYFLLACLVTLTAVQALGRTGLSEDSPDINTENLLVLLGPMVLVYGASLFYLLLDRLSFPFPQLRFVVAGLFALIASLPLVLTFLPPRSTPLSYPPYYPPAIQQVVGWTKPDELIMSDIPWAVAWYGQSQCVWLSLDSQSSFMGINDYQKPIQALYISRLTLDGRFLPQMVRSGEKGWGQFILNCLFRKSEGKSGPPPGFPLQFWQPGWPDQFLLTFREHWPRSN